MKIFVDCVNCGKEFDILTAKRCSHQDEEHTEGTRVCSHCGKCACDALAPFDSTEHEIVQLEPSIQGIGYLIVKQEDCRAARMVGEELEVKSEFKRYRKRPVIIRAKQMEKSFTVRTMEGKLRGKAGGYLVIGVKGEKYPVDKEIFEETYEEIKR